MDDRIEFYTGDGGLLATSKSSYRFEPGDIVNIKKVDWRVVRVTYAVDHSESLFAATRQCVFMLKAPRGG